ncbi:Fic family protein [Cellulomonas fimi]|uniref:Fic family protein n=1 Tax=Cellulomonas sp. RIT-PI-Y TaxID=3035297 RepID=UPI0021D90971
MGRPRAERPADDGPDPLAGLLGLAGVADAVEAARTACEELRWHEGFRRRWREVRAEADLRAVRGSAAVDGARVPLTSVRRLAVGSVADDPDLAVVAGALRATTLAARWRPDLGAPGGPPVPPLGELLARLHTAAMRDLLPSTELGRLRGDEPPRDLTGLGPAPTGAVLAGRMTLLARMLSTTRAPAVVAAAVLHGEVLALRPFAAGNGIVARAAARLVLVTRGLDPTGAVVAEESWAQSPNPYLGAAAGFATGSPDGVAGWIASCARSVVDGAEAGRVVAEAVLAGRLGESPVGEDDPAAAPDTDDGAREERRR